MKWSTVMRALDLAMAREDHLGALRTNPQHIGCDGGLVGFKVNLLKAESSLGVGDQADAFLGCESIGCRDRW